jgi:hypothetical protein
VSPFDDSAHMLPSVNAAPRFHGPVGNGAPGRSVRRTEPIGFPTRERTMGDKSPKHDAAKKPQGKSIKERRLEKKAKTENTPQSQMENLTHGRK